MRLSAPMIAILAFATAAGFAWLAAIWGVEIIEARSRDAVSTGLSDAGMGWAATRADGLQVLLTGTAPSEGERFRALTLAGSIVDSARVIDKMVAAEASPVLAPGYSVEILRNDDGISLIGLIPDGAGRAAILAAIADLAAGEKVTDMLNTAVYPAPAGWDAAVAFGVGALKGLPRSKISISASRVAVTAISDSAAEKRRLEADLRRTIPAGLVVDLEISAPRPVITPFTLRFLIDDDGARFDACSADTPASRDIILQAAAKAGMSDSTDCVIGLGVPSPNWADAVSIAIAGLKDLGGGALTFSDADISLIAGRDVSQSAFDRVVGDLEAKLPDIFSLKAVMPEKTDRSLQPAQAGPAEFTAILADDGQVQLRGRLTDQRVRDAVDAYARARFGAELVYTAARLDPDLPAGWPIRVLSALEALAELNNGSVIVQANLLEIAGVTGNPAGAATIARILAEKLGGGQEFNISVFYDKALDPNAGLPTPQECGTNITTLIANRKISFEPGKAEIDPAANPTLDGIAKVLRRCGSLPFEIGGHTDAQGRDQMNLSLSQARAEAVLTALVVRGVAAAGLTAKGYGETQPIADNKSEGGRETNRRIEFRLLLSEAEAARIARATVAADAAAPVLATDSALRVGTAQTAIDATAVTDGATQDRSATTPGETQVTVQPAAENQIRPKPRPSRN